RGRYGWCPTTLPSPTRASTPSKKKPIGPRSVRRTLLIFLRILASLQKPNGRNLGMTRKKAWRLEAGDHFFTSPGPDPTKWWSRYSGNWVYDSIERSRDY